MTKFFIKRQLPIEFKPIESPVYVHLWFGLRRPQAHFGTGKNNGDLKESAPMFPIVKPDFDNLEKFILDCMSNLVFKDDRQVVSCRTDKRYTDQPRTEIIVQELVPENPET